MKITNNLYNCLFSNQEKHKSYLRTCFEEFSKLSYKDMLNYCKMREIEKMKTCMKTENKIFNTADWENFNIEPVLEFCENNKQTQLYQYYRKKVSSLPLTGVVGRAIRILVKDNITNKYIGIMCLSSDVYNLGERDIYIKKTNTNINEDWKDKYLKNIMNLSCCVPLQPFGFNTNGGKLIASFAFSREIFDYYYNKYKEPLFAIITTSINGKSIQYDRLKCLKMIGYTKGYGSVNIPDELYKVCQEYNNIWKIIPKTNRIDRFNFLKNILKHLELPQNILQHNNKRGIYFGYIFSTKLYINYNIEELQNVYTIYKSWKERWCNNRVKNLINKNAIKNIFDLYTNQKFNNSIKFELPKIQEKIITDDLIKEILTYKLKTTSQNEVCEILNKKYNIQLNRNDISRVYKGNILPELKDEEYLKLLSVKTSKKKITDDEIYYILDYYNNKYNYINNKPPSYSNIVEIFNKIFNKKITKGTISDVILGNIKPIIERNSNNKKDKNCNIENKFKLLKNEQIINIIKMKSESKTTQEVSKYIKDNYTIYINRNLISKLWNGELNLSDEIKITEEYIDMLKNNKKRTVKSKKFTEEELDFVKNYNGSLNKCCKDFFTKYNKTISDTYILKLRKEL
jgi:hypothetical protein